MAAAVGGADAAIPEGPVWPDLHAFDPPSADTYSRWRLGEYEYAHAAIPLGRREGGILLALPLAFRDAAAL
eukprot:5992621-Pyramimonas_sp.AAC.1